VKKLLRSDAVQEFLGWLSWLYLELVIRTIRWTRIGEEPGGALDQVLRGPGGMIGCFWHGNIALSITAKVAVIQHKLTRILISLSPDGEFIARSMVRHDMPPIRGSSAKKNAKDKAKGGAAAFREALDLIASGGILVVTPDGPRGPAEQMAAGTVRIAKRTGAPVFLLGLAAHPVARLKTWDGTRLPGLFGRGCIVWDGPHFCPPDAADADIERLAAQWSAAMTAACARAEAMIAPQATSKVAL
jgi:lysophospholipid acyltransferase (LPLAT)-like uncharacterized protein